MGQCSFDAQNRAKGDGQLVAVRLGPGMGTFATGQEGVDLEDGEATAEVILAFSIFSCDLELACLSRRDGVK